MQEDITIKLATRKEFNNRCRVIAVSDMRYDRRRIDMLKSRNFAGRVGRSVPFPRDSADGRRNLDGDYTRAAQDDALVALIPGIHGLL